MDKLTLNQMVSDFVGSDYCDRKESAFALFVLDCYEQEERDQVMEGLMACACCDRHKNKDPVSTEPKQKTIECKCNCRHYARFFKRNNLA